MRFSPTKIALSFIVCAGLVVPSVAAAQSTPSLAGLYACEAIANKEEQLTCFRAETAKLRAGVTPAGPVATPQAPNPAPAPVPAIASPAPAEPEFAPLKKKEAKAPKSRTMAIRSTSTTASGHVRFTLDNGEVWQQIEKERVRLGRGSPDTLTIKRKSFGSFLGNVNGKRPSFRVRRVE